MTLEEEGLMERLRPEPVKEEASGAEAPVADTLESRVEEPPQIAERPDYLTMTREEFEERSSRRKRESRDRMISYVRDALRAGNTVKAVVKTLGLSDAALAEYGFVKKGGKLVPGKDIAAAKLSDFDGDGIPDYVKILGQDKLEFVRVGFVPPAKETDPVGFVPPAKETDPVVDTSGPSNSVFMDNTEKQFYAIVSDGEYDLFLRVKALDNLADARLTQIALDTDVNETVRLAAVQKIREPANLHSTILRTMQEQRDLVAILNRSEQSVRLGLLSRMGVDQLDEIRKNRDGYCGSFYEDTEKVVREKKNAAARDLLGMEPAVEQPKPAAIPVTESRREIPSNDSLYAVVDDGEIPSELRIRALNDVSETDSSKLVNYAISNDPDLARVALTKLRDPKQLARVVREAAVGDLRVDALVQIADSNERYGYLSRDLKELDDPRRSRSFLEALNRTNARDYLSDLTVEQLSGLRERMGRNYLRYGSVGTVSEDYPAMYAAVDELIKEKKAAAAEELLGRAEDAK